MGLFLKNARIGADKFCSIAKVLVEAIICAPTEQTEKKKTDTKKPMLFFDCRDIMLYPYA